MKKVLSFGLIAIAIASCSPGPESLANKYSKEIHSFLESAIANVPDSASAYEMASPLVKSLMLFDSLYNAGIGKFEKEEDFKLFMAEIMDPIDDTLYTMQWERVVEKNRQQLKGFPINTWLINEDTMSPSNIFKLNKSCTKLLPYNDTRWRDFKLPSDESSPALYSLNKMLFLNYNPQSDLMEIRTLEGKIGHFRKASTEELVMGLYIDGYGDELFVNKDSKVIVENNTIWPGSIEVAQITINDEVYGLWKRGTYQERGGAIDALVEKNLFYYMLLNGEKEEMFMRRKAYGDHDFDFMLYVPEEEKNLEEAKQ